MKIRVFLPMKRLFSVSTKIAVDEQPATASSARAFGARDSHPETNFRRRVSRVPSLLSPPPFRHEKTHFYYSPSARDFPLLSHSCISVHRTANCWVLCIFVFFFFTVYFNFLSLSSPPIASENPVAPVHAYRVIMTCIVCVCLVFTITNRLHYVKTAQRDSY